MARVRLLLCVCTLLSLGAAHFEYVQRNPNGDHFGAGLGHLDPTSPGARNKYGEAFDAAGRQWSQALCAADADGDGQSNGHELGDECCFWTANASCTQPVLTAANLSNPGDATSMTSRPSCNCSADAALRCACCDLQPCSGGGGGGGGDDDDDDDDDDRLIYVGAGVAALVALSLAAYCFWQQRKAASARDDDDLAGAAGYESLLAVN